MVKSFATVGLVILALTMGAQVASAQAIPSQAQHDPPWLLLELGKRAFRERNFGQALDYFRTTIARGGVTPEAEMWIGRVFEQEGELDLAETQYNRALASSSQFQIPGETTAILYDLARIYNNTNQYGKYEVTLKKIVAEDSTYSSKKDSFTRQSMVHVLVTDGLDKLLVLYRLHDKPTLDAHAQLGELYYRTGRYSQAIMNLTFAAITTLTVAIDAFKAHDPEFHFSTMNNLMQMAQKSSTVSDYLASTHLFRTLYYLGSSLYGDGHEERSETIWRTVTRWSRHDVWYRRSESQLQHPRLAPVLSING